MPRQLIGEAGCSRPKLLVRSICGRGSTLGLSALSSSTIYLLLAGLLRYAGSKTRDCPNFMDKKDGRFYELSGTCESVARKLRVQGVGANVKHAQVVTPEEEDQL